MVSGCLIAVGELTIKRITLLAKDPTAAKQPNEFDLAVSTMMLIFSSVLKFTTALETLKEENNGKTN